MKVNRTLLAAGLFSALTAMAFGQSTNTNTNLTTSASKPEIQPVYPVVEYKLESKLGSTNQTDKIIRFGKESSRAWATIVEQQPNRTVVHDASKHEPDFCLFSFGNEPWW